MALKCMEFCQVLTSQGAKFSFNLTTGTGFSFSLDTKESGKPAFAVAEQAKRKKKKKLSPSDLRRNLREDFKYYFADFVRKRGGGGTPQIRNPLFAEKNS